MWTLNQFCVVTGDFPDFCFSVQCCVTLERVLCSSLGCTYHELCRRAQEGWVRERNPWNCWFMVTGCLGASCKAVPKSMKVFQLALRALSKAQNDYQGTQRRLFACWEFEKRWWWYRQIHVSSLEILLWNYRACCPMIGKEK